MTEGLDVLSLLTDGATVARWNNENLPSDRMSIENATILTNAERWPLMIDPQLQGIKWIKTREGEELKVIRLGQKGYVRMKSMVSSMFTYIHKIMVIVLPTTVRLYIISHSYSRYLDSIERAVANGDCLLLESIGESVDPVLDPLLGRLTIKKGKYIKIGDKEVEYHPKFRLILQVSETIY